MVVGVEIDKAFHARPECLDMVSDVLLALRIGEDNKGAAVLEHIGDAICGIVWIDGDICAARLENSEHGDDHCGASLQADGDAVIGSDAEGDQVMGKLVGLAIECAIGQLTVFEADGNGFRLRIHARLDQIHHRLLQIKGAIRRIELVKHDRPFAFGKDVDLADGRLRVLFECLAQLEERALHHVADALWGDGGHGLCGEAETVGTVLDGEHDGIVCSLLGLHDGEARQGDVCVCDIFIMPIVEHG